MNMMIVGQARVEEVYLLFTDFRIKKSHRYIYIRYNLLFPSNIFVRCMPRDAYVMLVPHHSQ